MNTLTNTLLKQTIKPAVGIAIVLMAALSGASVIQAAWNNPTQAAPGGNTNPPLNDSATGQVKTGGISLGSLIVNGGSIFQGTTTFNNRLNINTDGANAFEINFFGTGSPNINNTTGNTFSFRNTGDSGDFVFTTGTTPASRFLIQANGQVGVGANITPSAGLQLDVEGLVGATEYCDENGTNCFTADTVVTDANPPTGDIGFWSESSGNVYRSSGNVAIGATSSSPGLRLDVAGRVGAFQYCDQDGLNCFSSAAVSADNLGNHIATQSLDLNGNAILGALSLVTTGPVRAQGGLVADNNRVVVSGTGDRIWVQSQNPSTYGYLNFLDSTEDRGGYIGFGNGADRLDLRLDTADIFYITGGAVGIGDVDPDGGALLDVAGNIAATSYCDGSGLNCSTAAQIANAASGDDLGNHTATQNLNMNGNNIAGVGTLGASGAGIFDGGILIDGNVVLSGTDGQIFSRSSSESNYGYINFTDASGSRGGYLGWGNGGSRLDLTLDDASDLYISGGSVGIGAIPANTFDNGKALAFGDSDTGIRQSSSGVLQFFSDNNLAFSFNGSATSFYSNDGSTVSVDAVGTTLSSRFYAYTNDNTGTRDASSLYRTGTGAAARFWSAGIDGTDDSYKINNSFSLANGNGPEFVIESSGSVGIGDPTPDGTLRLDIEGGVGATEYCDQNGTNCSTANDIATAVAGGAGSDDQTIDSFSLSGNTLSLSLEDDGEVAQTVSLASLLDNTDAQDLSLSGSTLSLTGDGTPVDLSSLFSSAGSDDQTIDSFSLSGNTLSLSLEDDGEVAQTVDLGPLLSGSGLWTDGGATTYIDGDNVAIGATSASYELDVDGDASADAFIYSSDRRLKTRFASFANRARDIMDVGTYEFFWKDSGEKDFGVIAQEVEALYPEAVVTGSDGYKAVDYAQLVVPLLEVTKQQQKEIKELQEAIHLLQQQ